MQLPEHNESNSRDIFDNIVADSDILPGITVENQIELLNAIKQRHEFARQEAGITLVAIDHLPIDAIGTDAKISLRRVMSGADIEEMFLRINYPVKVESIETPVWHNVFITVAERLEGAVIAHDEFDQDQARLVFEQADELTSLRTEGFLPNLQPDLDGIRDPKIGMLMLPPKPSET